MRTRRLILPFFSIPVTDAWPISPVRATWVPPHGWRSRPSIAIRRTWPGSHRRLDRHGLDQARIGLELRVGDPALAHRRVERDQFVEPALDLGLVDHGLARIEIEPPLGVADRSSGHRIGQDDREQMERGMGAHALEAQVPVDAGDHPRARRGQGGPVRRHMQNGRAVGVVDRVDDRHRRAALEDERPAIAALPSALRVEDRAIERHPPRLRGHHRRFGLGSISVVAKQRLGHLDEHLGRLSLRLQPVGDRQVLRAQKRGIEQLGGVTGAGIAQERHDRVAGAELPGEAERAGDVDPRRTAEQQTFARHEVEHDRHGLRRRESR